MLGRLDALGRDPGGETICFRWIVRVSLDSVSSAGSDDGIAARRARLFTGSGGPGLPAGFAFGEASIPLDAEPGEERFIHVLPDVSTREVHALFVRTHARPQGEGATP